MLRKLITLGASLSILAMPVSAFAAPFNAANNPNIVANYPNGPHTIVEKDGSIDYRDYGADVVIRAGNSNNFQQWFVGNNDSDHSVWMDVETATSCPAKWTFIENPYHPPFGDTWGYYFPPGDNYCVHTNDFGGTH